MYKPYLFIIIAYLLFGSTSLIAQEKKTVSPEVVAISEYTLKDSTQTEAFEKSMHEFLKIFNVNFPGIRWEVYKADRGHYKGKYIEVTTIDTEARRNYYFPQEGKMGEAFATIWNRPEVNEKWLKVEPYITFKWQGDYIKIK
ncbi:MAG: hypothetical protein ACOY90_21160 [Candidatus Zhuqueibacterota bacterium]